MDDFIMSVQSDEYQIYDARYDYDYDEPWYDEEDYNLIF